MRGFFAALRMTNYVRAVILSAAKDPEGLSLSPLSGPFQPKNLNTYFCPRPTSATVISTEAALASCERQSGEHLEIGGLKKEEERETSLLLFFDQADWDSSVRSGRRTSPE
jgi:hypothetical protein